MLLSAEEDAKALREAILFKPPEETEKKGTFKKLLQIKKTIKGINCDADTIIKILANRTNTQRQKIRLFYKMFYEQDLIEELRKALSGHFEDAIVALMYEPIEYDCVSLKNSLEGLGTDEDTIIEILCTRSNQLIESIKKKYKKMFNTDLVDKIGKDTSGTFKKLLIKLLEGRREETTEVDQKKCHEFAQNLYDAGEKIKGTNEDVFIKLFTELSVNSFKCTCEEYEKLIGHSLRVAVENEFSGDSKKTLITIFDCLNNPTEYFASRVYKAIKGLGTNDKLLIRILVTRDEIDMAEMKECYLKNYKKTMIDAIKGDTSDEYQSLLVEIADH